MRDREQMLADELDGVSGVGPTPPEVRALAELGRRIREECANPHPAFIERLGQALQEEWARSRESARGIPTGWRLTRATALTIGVVALLLVAALYMTAVQAPAEAGLSRVITVFKGAKVEVAPPVTATPPSVRYQAYPSLEEAQAAAGFRIRAPSYLPNGLTLDGVTVSEAGGQRQVALQYSGPSVSPLASGPVVIQEFLLASSAEGEDLAFQVGAEGVVSVQIAGRPALWVQGQWTSTGRWERGGRNGLLMVQDGDVLIQVGGHLSQEECARVAESMLR